MNILIIDDDRLVTDSLTKLFSKNGWNVHACNNGKEGLQLISETSYDCVLLDVRMPGTDGPTVITELRKLEEQKKISNQRVIIITGQADENDTIKVFQNGVFHLIHKPFDIEQLLAKVNECANGKESLQTFENVAIEDKEAPSFKKVRKQYDRDSLKQKVDILSNQLQTPLVHIRGCTYDTNFFKGNIENPIGIVQIPLAITGPINVKGKNAIGEFWVPMATTEGALVLTYDLGMRLLKFSGPVEVEILSKGVHIDPVFPITSDEDIRVGSFVRENYNMIKKIAEGDSQHTKLLEIKEKRIGNNFVMKFVYDTADAHGLNMINNATFNACKFIESKTGATFYHRSHYSGIKHHALLNEKEGQGRCVKAKAVVSSKALAMLKVKAEAMEDFFNRCIECGTAAGISGVNVHAPNGLTAIFLACGQDAADISMSGVCATTAKVINGKDLLVETTIRNLLIGTVGGGTGLGTQNECLRIMECAGSGKADKFAEIITAAVLAGEFPTAAAVISRTYVEIHNKYGRNKAKLVRD